MQKIFKSDKQNTLKIASYNILYGGEERLNDIAKVIKNMNPDICGILEAVEWQNETTVKKISDKLEYNSFKLAVANSRHNIAIFSKIPLTIKIIKKGFRHVVLKATIKDGPFKNINIFFVHLSPVSEDARLLELNELFKYISKTDKVIIMGDFNSLSQNDPYDKKELFNIFQKNNIIKYGTNKLRFDVIKKIKSSGFRDAMSKSDFMVTTPTLSNKDIHHAANIRIDYAFLTKNIHKYLRKAEIFKNNTAEKASDHYPIFIKLHK